MTSFKYLLFITLIFVLIACKQSDENPTTGTPSPSKATPKVEIRPVFNAALLAGKNPQEVAKAIGVKPSESWAPTGNPSGLMQAYSIGQEMTVEYKGNRIDSFVIFFDDDVIKDSLTAYSLVGLDSSKPRPNGISNITASQNWIKVFYSRTK